MAETDARLLERTRDLPEAAGAAEPATGWALWPTFMRRTLSEEIVRREARVELRESAG